MANGLHGHGDPSQDSIFHLLWELFKPFWMIFHVLLQQLLRMDSARLEMLWTIFNRRNTRNSLPRNFTLSIVSPTQQLIQKDFV